MKKNWIRGAGWMAMCGLAVEVIGIAWAIHLWNQSHPEGYTFLRNFVSELGAPRDSGMARVFNGTISLSSLLALPVVYALGFSLRTNLARAAMVFGSCAGAGAIGVGIFPMDLAFLMPHLAAALFFFWGWLIAVFLFTLDFWGNRAMRPAPMMILAGILVWTALVPFLCVLTAGLVAFLSSGGGAIANGAMGAPVQHPMAFHRPAIWGIAVLEWCVLASTMLWNLAASVHLLRGRFLSSADQTS